MLTQHCQELSAAGFDVRKLLHVNAGNGWMMVLDIVCTAQSAQLEAGRLVASEWLYDQLLKMVRFSDLLHLQRHCCEERRRHFLLRNMSWYIYIYIVATYFHVLKGRMQRSLDPFRSKVHQICHVCGMVVMGDAMDLRSLASLWSLRLQVYRLQT